MPSHSKKPKDAKQASAPARLNLKDFAASLGVSISTVSRVLSGRAEQNRIAPATRELILEAARKQDVIVDQVGRGLRLQQTLTIGLVMPDIANPFFASFACLVEKAARAQGYTVLLCDSQECTAIEAELVRLLQARRVDGLILAPVGETYAHLLRLKADGTPIVLVDRVFPEWDVPSVVSDNFNGALLAVQHLVACGHRRIGCVQGLPGSYSNQERLRGYRAGLKEAGIQPAAALLRGSDFTAESGYRSALEFCRAAKCPTALLALGNLLALGTVRAIHECGLRVPQDISMVSFDEQPWAAFLSPSLTTVAQPVEALAEEAFARLLTAMRGEAAPGRLPNVVTLPVRLICRESVLRR